MRICFLKNLVAIYCYRWCLLMRVWLHDICIANRLVAFDSSLRFHENKFMNNLTYNNRWSSYDLILFFFLFICLFKIKFKKHQKRECKPKKNWCQATIKKSLLLRWFRLFCWKWRTSLTVLNSMFEVRSSSNMSFICLQNDVIYVRCIVYINVSVVVVVFAEEALWSAL